MRLKSLEFKNIGPYGNIVQRLDFTDKNELINIAAKVGSGKSTIINTLNFALYGKVKDLKISDIVNRINKKNAWVKLVLEDNNKTYEIERGIAPNKFSVAINGVLLDIAGKKNVQDYLEEEVYKMNFNVFTNTISLSVNDFKSFLIMSPADKRNIIDRLFGYHVINEITDNIKKKKAALDESSKRYLSVAEEKNNSLLKLKDRIIQIRDSEDVDYTKENIELQEQIGKLKNDYLDFKEKLTVKNEEKEKVISIKEKANNAIMEIKSKIRNIAEKLKLYNNSKCPTCGSNLTDETHTNIKNILEEEKSKLEEKFEAINKKTDQITAKINSIKSECNKIKEIINEISQNNNVYKSKIESNSKNQKKNKAEIIAQFKQLMINTKKELKVIEEDLEKDKAKIEYYKVILEEILSEKGIRGVLTNRIIGPLNILIQKYINIIDFDKQIKLNDKFDVEVKHIGQDINIRTLSTGERKKADIIMILSLIELIKLQNPSINILVLDEIFSSLDESSIEFVVDALKLISVKFNLNVFIISHTKIERTAYDSIIDVVKENGFSNFEYTKVR